jgi:hypothetical protein
VKLGLTRTILLSLLALVPAALSLDPTLALAQAPPPPAQPSPPFQIPPLQIPQMPWLPGAPASSGAPPAPGGPVTPTPTLGPLIGAAMWQAEVRSVLNEVTAHLTPEQQQRVQGIPLVFDPNPNTINAFAGCDEKGSPFVAATEGLLEAIDAISQTVANDDLFGTRTYDQYIQTVMPRIVSSQGIGPALPLGIIPFTTVLDFRRISHAHELFDNIVAFTFGHELSHHYLGHTGCANGASAMPPPVAFLAQAGKRVFSQPLEIAADSAGTVSTLDAGRARRPNFVWTERGGLLLLDFFARMESAAGVSVLSPVGFLQTHPHPAIRIPVVQAVAQGWHQTHPG